MNAADDSALRGVGTPDAPNGNAPASGAAPRWLRYVIGAVAVVAVLAIAFWIIGRMRPPEMRGTVLQAPDAAADFVLTGGDGQPVHLSDFEGKWTLLYFGYTFCPDVCPTTLADLNVMMRELGNRADDVQVIMVSVDPERDSPARLNEYLSYFNPSFVGLTGDVVDIEAAATQFGVYYAKRETEGASGYLVDHTSTVAAIDPQGRMRIVFPYGVSGEDMAADLEYLMRRG
jgi:protein SCO1/2